MSSYKRPSFIWSGLIVAAFPAWLAYEVWDFEPALGWMFLFFAAMPIGIAHWMAGPIDPREAKRRRDAEDLSVDV